MAITVHRRAHAGRALASQVMRRSSLAARYANASYPPVVVRDTNPAGDAVVPNTKAITGASVFLGIVVFAVIGLLIWRFKNRQAAKKLAAEKAAVLSRPSSADSEKSSFDPIYGFGLEKPKKAHVTSNQTGGRWVPQLRADIVLPEPKAPRSSKAKKNWEKNLAKFMTPKPNPPAYYESDPNAPIVRVIPPIPKSADRPFVAPPTPMKPSVVESPPITPDSRSHLLTPPSQPSATKKGPTDLFSLNFEQVPEVPEKGELKRALPRLMSCTTTFTPTMEDELAITVGDTVRLLEEYADEWCLIQYVGHIDEVKGVVPRFCLSERQQMVPSQTNLARKASF